MKRVRGVARPRRRGGGRWRCAGAGMRAGGGPERGGFRGRSCPSRRCAAANWASIGLAPEAGRGEAPASPCGGRPRPGWPGLVVRQPTNRPPRSGCQPDSRRACGSPVRERAAELGQACGGRLDDVLFVVTADLAGGLPPTEGPAAANPRSLKEWMTSRTVSSCAWTSRAIAGTVVPNADAMMINAAGPSPTRSPAAQSAAACDPPARSTAEPSPLRHA